MASVAYTPTTASDSGHGHRADSGKAMVRAGWAVSGLMIAFLVLDAGMKIAQLSVVTEGAAAAGWPVDPAFWSMLGVVLLGSTALYAWPRTSVIGAILLTAYMGGAIGVHARIGDPLITHTLFGVYIAVLLWLGLWLRSPALRALTPLATNHGEPQ